MDLNLYEPFMESIQSILMQMANVQLERDGEYISENDEIISYGVSSIIAYSGKLKGRLLLDLDKELALKIAENITGIKYASTHEYMVLASISELNNIVAGDGITKLNNRYSYGLRLAPPIVFTGKDTIICIPKISSVSLNCKTIFGKIKINAAFERSL
jgi:chemotaxis protein CheX